VVVIIEEKYVRGEGNTEKISKVRAAREQTAQEEKKISCS
jgi:hypothetical protein